MPSPKPSSNAIEQLTWCCFPITDFYIYAVNVLGNVAPLPQAEFTLGYGAVSLQSSAVVAGIIPAGLFGD